MSNKIIVRNIKLPYDAPEQAAFEAAKKRLESASINVSAELAKIYKKSVDARKSHIKPAFIYSVSFDVENKPDDETLKLLDASFDECLPLSPVIGSEKLETRPVVIGFGPCGMFAALMLAEHGYKPLVLERGMDVDNRNAAVKRFMRTGVLEESNIQFGAGGAGTFSDGKLVTRISDAKCSYVLDTMYKLGAPEEILYAAKPHVGTDKLLTVVRNAAHRIKELGGEIKYNTKLEDIVVKDGKVTEIVTNSGNLPCSLLILAIGHSARDTYEMLATKEISMEAKPFSVGVRIEHFQKRVDESLYGKLAGDKRLPCGEYALSHRSGNRGVYTFCMCPGGEVVAAASEEGGVVTNGMSRYARDGRNANSAIAVSVLPEDFGHSPLDGIEFQRKLERAAFVAGGGKFRAPCETVGDFLEGKTANLRTPGIIKPTYMNGRVKPCDLNTILPKFVGDMLRQGLSVFAKKMRCFGDPAAVLTGVETRTSAPLRILRCENFTSFGVSNMYPAGEGAGYAGGITSAAVDGINTAFAVMERYAPLM